MKVQCDFIALFCCACMASLLHLFWNSQPHLNTDIYFDSQQMVKCKQCVTGQKNKPASENSRVHLENIAIISEMHSLSVCIKLNE